ncbi:NADH dehydrogenase [ubiquinone] 1 alpha subcomplex subunit 7-like [Eriocheir sinensis]|uniref:NADH dehydrogenase [ubiquinone] 1 alpha subcomplex subunit 7-like n=1 Tax=Eriocheir sinensis TaxID=95602 RepID=UPI0021C7C394|nr:NADH dehydrogenase [ubiquinone] 1 alpha subcomplex subunit 7-like [Eriocheir sinensis]
MPRVHYRDVSPFFRRVRVFLLGRDHTSALRQADFVVCRSQPPPDLPKGVSAAISGNYYYMRDGRRSVDPNEVVAINSSSGPTVLLSAESEGDAAVTVAAKKPKLPGVMHNFD